MTSLIGLVIVTTATSVAVFINDRFDRGGYIDDENLSAYPQPREDAKHIPAMAMAGKTRD
jgi:hypothetical protein